MFRAAVFVMLFSLSLCLSSFAFDGNRKGLVLGGGLGFAPAIEWRDTESGENESDAGFGFGFFIGYAWDEYNMVAFEGNTVTTNVELFDRSITQGFNGISFYHYFGEKGKTAFLSAGIGLYSFDIDEGLGNLFSDEEEVDFDSGFGLLLGAGYEFSAHWQFGCYLASGSTSPSGMNNIDFGHLHINFLFSAVAF